MPRYKDTESDLRRKRADVQAGIDQCKADGSKPSTELRKLARNCGSNELYGEVNALYRARGKKKARTQQPATA